MTNAADPKQVKESAKREKQAREVDLEDLQVIMGAPEGRRFMHRLLDFCGAFRSPFSPNGSQANFNMGQQNVGFKLLADIEDACPDLYLLMKQEAKHREANNDV